MIAAVLYDPVFLLGSAGQRRGTGTFCDLGKITAETDALMCSLLLTRYELCHSVRMSWQGVDDAGWMNRNCDSTQDQ